MKASSSSQDNFINARLKPEFRTVYLEENESVTASNKNALPLNAPPPTPPRSPTFARFMNAKQQNETQRFIGTRQEYKTLYPDAKKALRRVSFSEQDTIKHIVPTQELDDLCFGYAEHTGYWPKKSDIDDMSGLIYDLTPNAFEAEESKNGSEKNKECENLPQITRKSAKLWIKRLFDDFAASQL